MRYYFVVINKSADRTKKYGYTDLTLAPTFDVDICEYKIYYNGENNWDNEFSEYIDTLIKNGSIETAFRKFTLLTEEEYLLGSVK